MLELWTTYLVTPLLNVLIELYNTVGFDRLWLAVVWLTVAVRIVLIPFSFLAERNQDKYTMIGTKWEELTRDVQNDHVLQRQLLREYVKQMKVSPWARTALLGTQLFILVLLYQVFVSGLADPAHLPLYDWVRQPAMLNTSFFGLFDIAERNVWIAFVVGAILYTSIALEQRKMPEAITRQNLWFRLLFPLSTVFLLALLPAVKALYILTSIAFTVIFHIGRVWVQRRFAEARASDAVVSSYAPEGEDQGNVHVNPWEALRK